MKTFILTRETYTDESTIGRLSFEGEHISFTLEDKVRAKGEKKVHGKTAIPAGKYELTYGWSPTFKRNLPRILNVPGFSGILLHGGNTSDDSRGCCLCGLEKGENKIWNCAPAIKRISELLLKYKNKEKIYIIIK